MMHHLAHYNWAGILFTLLILPASGMMTVGLRCWSQRIEQKKRDRRNVMPWRDYWHMLRLGIGWSRRNLRPVEAEPVVWARRSTDRATSCATVVPEADTYGVVFGKTKHNQEFAPRNPPDPRNLGGPRTDGGDPSRFRKPRNLGGPRIPRSNRW